MKRRALRFLLLTGLFQAALCVLFGDHFYVTKELTWFEAREYCRAYYTDLSSIHSLEENKLFLNVDSLQLFNAWIGLYKDANGTWTWSGGTSPSFFHWSNENVDTFINRCVLQTPDGWVSTTCYPQQHSFYCFQSSLVLVKENKTWDEALKHCRNMDTELMSLSSEAAQVKALQTVRKAETDLVWTGLRYLGDSWLWVDGTDVDYQAWSQEETPQCPVWGHHCGALSLEGRHWVSWDCADELNFVCF